MKQKITLITTIFASVMLSWFMAKLCMDAQDGSPLQHWYGSMAFVAIIGGVPIAMWLADT